MCPDFVIELLSPSDKLSKTQAKMQEYLDNGVQLGWLINPQNQQIEIYRQNKTKEILARPDRLSGENILTGFTLDLLTIW